VAIDGAVPFIVEPLTDAWKIGLAVVGLVGVFALIIQAIKQSLEDHERDEKERERDKNQQTMLTHLAVLAGDRPLVQNTLPAVPLPNFKFDDYFRLAHASQLTEQTQKDIKGLVEQQHPNDREETLERFIGMGYWGYMHEVTWFLIFRSQLLALTELNQNSGLLPLARIRTHFDKAFVDYPDTYANGKYTFDQWMNFMVERWMWIKRPADMIEIATQGRDFLKFLTHWGWTADTKRN